MRKLFRSILAFIVTTSMLLVLYLPVSACNGTSCRGIYPYDSTDSYGQTCAASAYTVYESSTRTSNGTYGTVQTDLRFSYSSPDHGCYSNWARGWVNANNSNTKFLYVKVWEKSTPSWGYYDYLQGNPLAVGSSTYTKMVNGASGNIAVAFAGLASSSWSGPYSPSFQYEG
jgi:hypothetical protein